MPLGPLQPLMAPEDTGLIRVHVVSLLGLGLESDIPLIVAFLRVVGLGALRAALGIDSVRRSLSGREADPGGGSDLRSLHRGLLSLALRPDHGGARELGGLL